MVLFQTFTKSSQIFCSLMTNRRIRQSVLLTSSRMTRQRLPVLFLGKIEEEVDRKG